MNRRDAIKGTAMIFGYAISAGTVGGLLQSCQSGPDLNWIPANLNEDQAKTLSAIIDKILPKTGTPGGVEIGIDQFIDKILGNVFPKETISLFGKGLDDWNSASNTSYGKDFVKVSPEQQVEQVQKAESDNGPLPGGMWSFSMSETQGFPFYRMMKEIALLGYFSSEKLGKEVLAYDPIPGPYQGCIPYESVGKIWTES